MAKTLCEWKKHDIHDKIEELAWLVHDPRYICKKCARSAHAEKHLCKPMKLPKVHAEEHHSDENPED